MELSLPVFLSLSLHHKKLAHTLSHSPTHHTKGWNDKTDKKEKTSPAEKIDSDISNEFKCHDVFVVHPQQTKL